MRIASPGHAAFAATMIALGIMGLIKGDFTAVWGGVPEHLPGRAGLAHVCAILALACGTGLFFRRTQAVAALGLLAYLAFWLIVFKGQFVVRAPLREVSYQTCGETATIVAAAWVLYARLAGDWGKRWLGFAVGDNGVRIARVLFALALIAFGLSHFFYVQMTAPLVPEWLGWPVGWAYFTGCTYLAAGVAVLTGVLARLAATLTAVQMALFGLLIWLPRAVSGDLSAFQWGEAVVTVVLAASAWVVAESYHGAPWFSVFRRAPAPARG